MEKWKIQTDLNNPAAWNDMSCRDEVTYTYHPKHKMLHGGLLNCTPRHLPDALMEKRDTAPDADSLWLWAWACHCRPAAAWTETRHTLRWGDANQIKSTFNFFSTHVSRAGRGLGGVEQHDQWHCVVNSPDPGGPCLLLLPFFASPTTTGRFNRKRPEKKRKGVWAFV